MGRRLGFLALFVGSEVVGVIVGEMFFRFHMQAIPPMAVSNFNAGAAHLGFMGFGLLAGILIFAWTLLAGGVQAIVTRATGGRKEEA